MHAGDDVNNCFESWGQVTQTLLTDCSGARLLAVEFIHVGGEDETDLGGEDCEMDELEKTACWRGIT